MVDKNIHQNEQFVYLIDGDLSYLKRKLKKGSKVLARIVLRLENNKYILRIFGYNLIMQSKLAFNRFDEVELIVKQVSPNFVMSIAAEYQINKKRKGIGSGSKKMDLFV